MKSRACKPPALGREAAPTPAAIQQLLPLDPADTAVAARADWPDFVPAERLWFCLWLPQLPLEAAVAVAAPAAVVEERHGVSRILLANDAAKHAGVVPGQTANAALALLPTLQLEERSVLREQQVLEELAGWLERFSPVVSIAGDGVLLLEVAGSLRFFEGLRALRQKILRGLQGLGFTASPAIAPTPLAATWLARSGQRVCIRDARNLAPALRELSLACLDWPPALCDALAGMGARTVGDCLRLPREGFTRRFGAQSLLELDRALGHLPDPRPSWRAPERFCGDYEMSEEQADRALLLNICDELLLAHERFLLARQLGTQRLCFSFFHLDGPATELRLGCAQAERSASRWSELLAIRFERLVLPAPVIAVRLQGGVTQPLQATSGDLNFHGRAGAAQQRFSITQLAERLVARIGDQAVRSTATVAEHRPHYAWRSQSLLADGAGRARGDEWLSCRKRPLWMLPEPVRLSAEGGYPVYRGHRLHLVEGPERLETGWWDEDGISRDYYMAEGPDGRQLWIFRNRTRESSWYLQGYFG
jgi:protein ImuB